MPLAQPREYGAHRAAAACRASPRISHFSTGSIGVTTFCGHKASADQLLRRADQAMYKAKSAGRNQLQFYNED